MNEHRRFLKGNEEITSHAELGNSFPGQLKVGEQSVLDLRDHFNSGRCVIAFFLSTRCAACKPSEVKSYIEAYPNFTYMIFVEGTAQDQVEVARYFQGQNVYRVEMNIIREESSLKIRLLPWMLGLNPKGQIVAGGAFERVENIVELSKILLRVYHQSA